jgi:hypothetical protein
MEWLPAFVEAFSAYHRKTVANLPRFPGKEWLMQPPKEIKLTWAKDKSQFRKYIGGRQHWLGNDRAKAMRLAWDIQAIWEDRQSQGDDGLALA